MIAIAIAGYVVMRTSHSYVFIETIHINYHNHSVSNCKYYRYTEKPPSF